MKCEVAEFDLAIAVACIRKSQDRLGPTVASGLDAEDFSLPDYFYSRGCLVISFDRSWYPYLDNTRGYNRGEQRWHVPKNTNLLIRVADSMKACNRAQPGGRTLLCRKGALLASNLQTWLLEWTLESDSKWLP